MRTTLVIDDAVLAAARRRAVDLDLTLSALVERSLRVALDDAQGPSEPPFRLPTWGDAREPIHRDPKSLDKFLEDEEVERLGNR